MNATTCALVGIAAFALGVAGGECFLSPAHDNAQSELSFSRLESKVDDLVRTVTRFAESRSVAAHGVPAPVADRSVVADGQSEDDLEHVRRMAVDTLRDLQLVRDEVRWWLHEFDATGARLHEAVRQNSDPKWDVISSFGFGGEEEGWKERALKEVYLMTPTEIIRRFGAPSGINADGWYWVRHDVELQPGEVRELDIGLSQGLVVGVGVNCE